MLSRGKIRRETGNWRDRKNLHFLRASTYLPITVQLGGTQPNGSSSEYGAKHDSYTEVITETLEEGDQSRSAPVTARLSQLNTAGADLPLLLAAEDRHEKDMLPLSIREWLGSRNYRCRGPLENLVLEIRLKLMSTGTAHNAISRSLQT